MEEEILTIEETMLQLKMTRGALAQLRYTGKGPRYMAPTPRTIRYRRDWNQAWLDAGSRVGTSEVAA